MCGVFGLTGRPMPREQVERALRVMAHRGPDGEGYFEDPGVQLAHRRLAIIDPAGGAQPMQNEDATVWIAFNGCVYNYLELRQSLLQKGHKFRTYTDTETVIHAYEEYGDDCVNRLIGMFAFAIWDKKRRKLFAARDRLGIKPFYYVQTGERLVFASEIKALLAAGVAAPELDLEALGNYVTFQCFLGDKTLFKGVKQLEPGHRMCFDQENGLKIERYWDLSLEPDNYHTEEYFIDRIKFLVEDAVKIRLRADVPVGAHLSGGLDSSTVVCLMSRLLGENSLHTFTGGFREGPAFDETSYAKIVSDYAGADGHLLYMGADDFAASIGDIMYYMDQPTAGPGVFPQYCVSRLASEHVKVVNGGQGGDEIFLGYARYLIAYLEECIKGAIWETADKAAYVTTLETIIPNLSLLKQYRPMLQYFWKNGLFEDADRRYFRLMDRSEGAVGIFSADVPFDRDAQFQQFQAVFNHPEAESLINRMSYFDIKVHLPALLQVEDRTSMAWSIESRVPLLDHRIAELIISIPPALKFAGGQPKLLLKRAVANAVPRQIIDRKDKMGFPVPLAQWLKGELRDLVRDTLFDQTCRDRGLFDHEALDKALADESEFGRVVWGALCLELWHRTFIDQPIRS